MKKKSHNWLLVWQSESWWQQFYKHVFYNDRSMGKYFRAVALLATETNWLQGWLSTLYLRFHRSDCLDSWRYSEVARQPAKTLGSHHAWLLFVIRKLKRWKGPYVIVATLESSWHSSRSGEWADHSLIPPLSVSQVISQGDGGMWWGTDYC